MKRYLAFCGQVYYPSGGMDDFIGDFDTINEAIKAIEDKLKEYRPDSEPYDYAWGHVYDTVLKKVVVEDGKEL